MWPYSWHLLHRMGSWVSLVMTTLEFEMKIRSIRRWLATMGEVQKTLTFAVFWFGAWCSGFLIHEAAMMEPSLRLCSDSNVLRWSLFPGEKEPLHGMNLNTTRQVCAWIFVVLQMHVSSSLSLQYVWKWSVCDFKSNSSSIALHSVNWSALIGCPEVDITWLVSWSSNQIHSLILPLSA